LCIKTGSYYISKIITKKMLLSQMWVSDPFKRGAFKMYTCSHIAPFFHTQGTSSACRWLLLYSFMAEETLLSHQNQILHEDVNCMLDVFPFLPK